MEDTFGDISADEDLEKEYGLDFNKEATMAANKQQSKPDAPDDPALTSKQD